MRALTCGRMRKYQSAATCRGRARIAPQYGLPASVTYSRIWKAPMPMPRGALGGVERPEQPLADEMPRSMPAPVSATLSCGCPPRHRSRTFTSPSRRSRILRIADRVFDDCRTGAPGRRIRWAEHFARSTCGTGLPGLTAPHARRAPRQSPRDPRAAWCRLSAAAVNCCDTSLVIRSAELAMVPEGVIDELRIAAMALGILRQSAAAVPRHS